MHEPETILAAQRQAAGQLQIAEIRRHIFLCCDQTVPKCCDKERSLAALK